MSKASFTLAIIGRPNVGKSTLFNRLVGRRLALVDDEPGVTRDRREGEGQLYDLSFRVIDTAGLEEAFDDSLEARMRVQTEQALRDSDIALFLIDGRAGVTPQDEHFVRWLRRDETPVIVVANKCEGSKGEGGFAETYALGLGDPVAISAEHGLGLSDLHDAISARLEAGETQDCDPSGTTPGDDEPEETGPLQLAIVGRPNVGKSTLVNALLGAPRLLTGPEAGITRDAITVDWHYKGRDLHLVDTAGLRRRPRVTEKLERLSVADAFRAVRYAEVVVLVIDAQTPMEKQDLTIARQVIEQGRALVIAVNKWDLCADRTATRRAIDDRLSISLTQVRGVPLVTLSALQGSKLETLMDAVLAAYDIWNKRIPTAELNRWLEAASAAHPPPAPQGRRLRLKYMTQAKTRPPTFAIFCTRPTELPDSYLRYLEKNLRETFHLPGTPLRLRLRKGKNPYA